LSDFALLYSTYGLFGPIWLLLFCQITVDFVCAYMMEAEIGFAFGFQRLPILSGGFQQGVGANYIGFDESCGAIDGAVYVTFSGQVHDGVWQVLRQNTIQFSPITDIDLFEGVALAVAHLRKTLKITGVGEFVEVNHFALCILDDVADDCGAYEAGAAGY
jgi:hypothetical protein